MAKIQMDISRERQPVGDEQADKITEPGTDVTDVTAREPA